MNRQIPSPGIRPGGMPGGMPGGRPFGFPTTMNKTGGGPAATKETDQLYRLFENNHNIAFNGGWAIFLLMMLGIILGIGFTGGIWESINNDFKTESFKGYCYGVWACLGFSGIMAIGFIYYFKYHVKDFHAKGITNINTIYGTSYTHSK